MSIEYLSVEDLIHLHDNVALARYSGLHGYDEGCLESKIAMPKSGFGEIEFYPGIFKKAAVYMYHLTTGHCFKDGNKRTGYLSAGAFLVLNGYITKLSDEELFEKCIEIANRETRQELEEVEQWLKENSIPFDFEEDPDIP